MTSNYPASESHGLPEWPAVPRLVRDVERQTPPRGRELNEYWAEPLELIGAGERVVYSTR